MDPTSSTIHVVYGGSVSIPMDNDHGKSYSVSTAYPTNLEAFDAVARLAQEQELEALLRKTYASRTTASTAIAPPVPDLDTFKSRLNLPPVLSSLVANPLEWMQGAAKYSDLSFEISLRKPTSSDSCKSYN